MEKEKIALSQWVLEMSDEELKALKAWLESRKMEHPQVVIDGVKRGLDQARAGLLTPHQEVMKKYAKYLK